MSGNDDDKDYPVGYGKAPKHTQFKAGQSGNPKGRPKQSKNSQTIMKRLLDEKVLIKVDGKVRKISIREALFRKVFYGAMEGKPAALKHALTWIEKLDPATNVRYVIEAPPPKTPEQWIKDNSPRNQDEDGTPLLPENPKPPKDKG